MTDETEEVWIPFGFISIMVFVPLLLSPVFYPAKLYVRIIGAPMVVIGDMIAVSISVIMRPLIHIEPDPTVVSNYAAGAWLLLVVGLITGVVAVLDWHATRGEIDD